MCKMQQNKQDKHAIINNKSELYSLSGIKG